MVRVSAHSLLPRGVLHNPLHLGIMSSEKTGRINYHQGIPAAFMMFYGINFSSVFVTVDVYENIFTNENSQHQCNLSYGAPLKGSLTLSL